MKHTLIVLTVVSAVCLTSGCSSPSDAIDDYPRLVQNEPLTAEALSVEIAAKMALSPWVEQPREVILSLGCTDEEMSYLSFGIVETIHKVHASDGLVYFVLGSVSLSDAIVEDKDGNTYDIEFLVNMPKPVNEGSVKLSQRLSFTVTGNGIMQDFEDDRLVDSKIIPLFGDDDEEYVLALGKLDSRIAGMEAVDADPLRIVPGATVSCEGDF